MSTLLAIERILSLIEFAKQSALLRSNAPQSVSQHKLFSRLEEKVLGLPNFHLNAQETDFEEVWLRIERIHEGEPPAPGSHLLKLWLELSRSPTTEPKLRPNVAYSKLIEIGALLVPSQEDAKPLPLSISLEEFPDREILEKQLQSYVEVAWKHWAAEEKERRKTIALYAELFLLWQQMQGNLVDSQIELVWGVGIAVWKRTNGMITYPVLTQLVEISLNEVDMSLEVRPRSSAPRLEVDIYAAQDNHGVEQLVKAGKEFFGDNNNNNAISPYEPSTYEAVLRSAVTFLDAHGVYWPDQTAPEDRALPKPTDNLVITDTWVLFARPRTASLFVQDLERFEKALGMEGLDLPPAVEAIVTEPADENEDVFLPSFRGLSMVGGNGGGSDSHSEKVHELYFPMQYNDEQVQIIQNLEAHDGVVVQGPPGTGKTHTIANVICHYLAQGKRVLVTSMKDPALAVLQEKIPEDIRPLAISLLTSEAEGMKQFEFAINKISAEVQRIDRSAYRQEIAQIDGRIGYLHAQIAKLDREVAHWATKNLEHITIDGKKLSPADAAKEVAINRLEIDWFPDKISIGEEHHQRFDNQDIVALRAARLILGADLVYLGKRVPQLAELPDSQKLLQVHQDLSKFAELKEQESAGQVPSLVNSSEETINDALGLATRINNLRLLRQELINANKPWIPDLQSYLRKAGKNEVLTLFLTLKGEIEQHISERRKYLAVPIEMPANLDQNGELLQAVNKLKQGLRPFGLVGLIGKGEQKKLLESIRIVSTAPASPEDWEYVADYLTSQSTCRALLTRWNALLSELPLPRLDVTPGQLGAAGAVLGLIDKIQVAITGEAVVTKDLKLLLPAWTRSERIADDPVVLDEAEANLTHHLVRHRLAQTWAIKESFFKALAGCSGAISERLTNFLNTRLGNKLLGDAVIQAEWSGLMEELRRVLDLASHLTTIVRITSLINTSGSPNWARSLRSDIHNGAHDQLLPDNWAEVWRLRRVTTYLDGIDGRHELKRMSRERTELEDDLAKQYRDAVTKRTWLRLSDNATPVVRAALEAYRAAIKKIGKGTGVRAVRYRQDARMAADRANAAIPCWIMPHYRICESLPPTFGCFDLVIIDEASQSDLTALPAILRAKKVLIVGDDKQVSPEGVGLEELKVRNLMGRFLNNQVEIYRAQMTPERSIYDLFKVVFAKSSVMLREHFRCVAPIIEYSKREFYNHELRPLRLPKASERLDPPLVDVYVEDGYRDKDFNPAEARFIVDEIRRIVSNPALDKRTIGVVSMVGNEQSLKVMQMVSAELGEEIVTRFKITCGDARTFQGKERDIMFLSMVVAPDKVTAQSAEMYAQRFNVAASRARDRMYLVRSVELSDLSPADVLRSRLIQHFQAPFAQNPIEVADLRQLCESPFEREVYDLLTERGYRVIPQVPVGAFRIDMVVEGDNDNRLAVECDGDQYHGPGQWDSDMRRQRILERAGWRFWRTFASTFVLQRDAVVADLIETLDYYGIKPTSKTSEVKTIHSEQRRVKALTSVVEVEIEGIVQVATVTPIESPKGEAEKLTAVTPTAKGSGIESTLSHTVEAPAVPQKSVVSNQISQNQSLLDTIDQKAVVVLTIQQYEDGPWLARAYIAEDAAFAFLRSDSTVTRYNSFDALWWAVTQNAENVLAELADSDAGPIYESLGDDSDFLVKQVLDESRDNGWAVVNSAYLGS
jgi:very-short-patch-repair endonuclease